MQPELKSLKIDRTRKRSGSSKWASRWILAGVLLLVLLGAGRVIYGMLHTEREVEVVRVAAPTVANSGGTVILNATGYVIAAHKIQVASKVLGRVAWIGVDKGDRVREGQVIVRLEDDEYKAQLQQAQGRLASLEARLAELLAGSREEEVARAQAEVQEAEASLTNAKIAYERAEPLVRDGVQAKQILDDARARLDREQARVNAVRKQFELVRIGPRKEQIASVRGQVDEAKGEVAFYQTQLSNTLIKAPTTGTILERAVEKGEFVTTSFVGDRGAKGYVASLADLNDLRVELDINQNDFAKLRRDHKAVVTTDAYPDRKYEGVIDEIAPEANRQKATVQVKVKVLQPDEYLRPEMNASVSFVEAAGERPEARAATPVVVVPPAAVRNNRVYLFVDGKTVVREIRTSGTTPLGLRVDSGLNGGEDLILNPPEDLKEGDRVRRRKQS
ncbi:MAG TPA: efflux RND transporter periplasmic adaptor subunit [Bryobacteraceae bacterium]|nr:efflux RND transporter periplasmic adaptor subunit [Bryobacteraceae bacterium]